MRVVGRQVSAASIASWGPILPLRIIRILLDLHIGQQSLWDAMRRRRRSSASSVCRAGRVIMMVVRCC